MDIYVEREPHPGGTDELYRAEVSALTNAAIVIRAHGRTPKAALAQLRLGVNELGYPEVFTARVEDATQVRGCEAEDGS